MRPFNPLRQLTTIRLSPPSSRLFSTTPTLAAKTITPTRLPNRVIPPYPYGPNRIYKQSNKGLYGGARIRFGHNVSEKHNVKTRRFWRPNVHIKIYHSPSLGANIRTRLTLSVLKSIKREGGIENYLLKGKAARVKEIGPGGWALRWLLMQTRAVQEQFNVEREKLGLEKKVIKDNEDVILFALDAATAGPLSQRSRETLAELRLADLTQEFMLGNEDLSGVEDVELLTPEKEEQLLREIDLEEQAAAQTSARQPQMV